MVQNESKLSKFNSAVLQNAQQQHDKILAEIEEYRKAQLEKAEEEILQEAYDTIQREIAVLRNRQGQKISQAELENRRRLLRQREAITEKVFDLAAERLLAYARTPDYADRLCASLRKSCGELPEGRLVVQVKPGDLKLRERLAAACGREAAVEENAGIRLGGFRIVNAERGVFIDATYDRRLKGQKDWFAASSGLMLGL